MRITRLGNRERSRNAQHLRDSAIKTTLTRLSMGQMRLLSTKNHEQAQMGELLADTFNRPEADRSRPSRGYSSCQSVSSPLHYPLSRRMITSGHTSRSRMDVCPRIERHGEQEQRRSGQGQDSRNKLFRSTITVSSMGLPLTGRGAPDFTKPCSLERRTIDKNLDIFIQVHCGDAHSR